MTKTWTAPKLNKLGTIKDVAAGTGLNTQSAANNKS